MKKLSFARLLVFSVAVALGPVVLLAGCNGVSTSGGSHTTRPGEKRVPDVCLFTLEQATIMANRAGLEIEVSEQIPSFSAQPNVVLAQSPKPALTTADGKLRVSVSREPIPVQIDLLAAYDPQGDKFENPVQVTNLTDGDWATSWSTELYSSSDFGGSGKDGVGLTFSLAEGATMAKIISTVTGWKGEVQRVTPEGTTALVADLGGQQVVNWQGAISSGRIWLTELAPLPGTATYAAALAEISFYR